MSPVVPCAREAKKAFRLFPLTFAISPRPREGQLVTSDHPAQFTPADGRIGRVKFHDVEQDCLAAALPRRLVLAARSVEHQSMKGEDK